MKNEFKVGDLVRCIDASASTDLLSFGAYYRVQKSNDDKGFLHMEGLNSGGWRSDRFVLEERKTEYPPQTNLTGVNYTARKTTLPTDSDARKDVPMFSGCLRYFPAALAGVANTSKLGNDKHNPGEEMHHARGKSTDQGDCILRHLTDVEDLKAALDRGDTTVTPQDILIEVNQLVWRALAFSQELHEKFGAPLAPGAKYA